MLVVVVLLGTETGLPSTVCELEPVEEPVTVGVLFGKPSGLPEVVEMEDVGGGTGTGVVFTVEGPVTVAGPVTDGEVNLNWALWSSIA